MADFKEKTKFFSSFYAKRSLINSKSFTIMTEKHLDNFIFSIDQFDNIILGLDPKKGYDQDKISIWMPKICGNLISKPLDVIYKECFYLDWFLTE